MRNISKIILNLDWADGSHEILNFKTNESNKIITAF